MITASENPSSPTVRPADDDRRASSGTVSVVVPVYNEVQNVGALIAYQVGSA